MNRNQERFDSRDKPRWIGLRALAVGVMLVFVGLALAFSGWDKLGTTVGYLGVGVAIVAMIVHLAEFAHHRRKR